MGGGVNPKKRMRNMDKYMYEENRLKMAHKAKSFGIAALAASAILFSIPYVGIGLGFLAILFAFLSKGYKPKLDKDAKIGVMIGTLGICVGVGILGTAFYKLSTDSTYRNDVLGIIDQMYGEEYEDLYGESITDMFNEMIGGGDSNVDL